MDIFTQTHIDIGHWPSLRRGSPAHSLRKQLWAKSAHSRAAMASRDQAKQTKVKAQHSDAMQPFEALTEVIMKIRELAQHWEQNAAGTLSRTGHTLHLDLESEARLAALIDMYPKRTAEELLGELVGAALEELEASFPYVQGNHVIATDEEGDPLFEDIGPTPRFLALSRRHLHDLSNTADDSEK
jgi:hypothetical protein